MEKRGVGGGTGWGEWKRGGGRGGGQMGVRVARLKDGKTLCLCPGALGDKSMCRLHGTIFLEIPTGKLWI